MKKRLNDFLMASREIMTASFGSEHKPMILDGIAGRGVAGGC